MNDLNKIAFIGGGNMARSIIGGLVAQGVQSKCIVVKDTNPQTVDALLHDFGIQIARTNDELLNQADVLVLAVKPQVMTHVCQDIAAKLDKNTLVISIAAGIDCCSLANWLGELTPLVRCMPNTPALLGKGASGLFANEHTSAKQKQIADTMLSAVGITSWVDSEPLIDAVTAVSGSGPAYFFLLLEAMIEEGVRQGLPAETSEALAKQTALGAAQLALESDVPVAELRKRVTSPGGTTEKAILSFQENGFEALVGSAMQACAARAQSLSLELGASTTTD